MRKLAAAAVAALVALAGHTAPARATLVDIAFAFNNTVGDTSGTVQGRITLDDSILVSQPAQHVYIDSYPAALVGTSGPDNGVDAVAWATQTTNSFTLAGGVITAVAFEAEEPAAGTTTADHLLLNIGGCHS